MALASQTHRTEFPHKNLPELIHHSVIQKENRITSLHQRLAISLTFHRFSESGEPETPPRNQAEEKRCIRKGNRNNQYLKRHSFNPASSLSLLNLANQIQHTQVTHRKSAPDHLTSPPKEALFKLTEISFRKHPVRNQLDGFSKPNPSPRNRPKALTCAAEFHPAPEETRKSNSYENRKSTVFLIFA
jgi:hypothetical protein